MFILLRSLACLLELTTILNYFSYPLVFFLVFTKFIPLNCLNFTQVEDSTVYSLLELSRSHSCFVNSVLLLCGTSCKTTPQFVFSYCCQWTFRLFLGITMHVFMYILVHGFWSTCAGVFQDPNSDVVGNKHLPLD